jgi:hypothetical protein
MDEKDLSILYLCEKGQYLYRTSRVRFHAVQAIEKKCSLIWSGPGWDNWDQTKTLNQNLAILYRDSRPPDLIFCYKPFNIKGFTETRIPACVSYNEMGTLSHPRSYTVKEIMQNHIDLVICHHLNEMHYPEFRHLPSKMVPIAHCAEKTIFKDYGLPKSIDVLLVGAIHWRRYPLRTRLAKLILQMKVDPRFFSYKLGIWNHPGGMHNNAYTNKQAIQFAKELNSAKICLTCSGRHRSRYGKYAEIPACRSLLMSDLPGENEDFFRQFTAVIDMEDSDQEIKDKILYYLQHDEERQRMTDLGYTLTQENYTQEHYADRFLSAVKEFLKEHGGKKLPYWSTFD